MGRVSTFLDVGAYLKIAATVAVALLAFGAMASPAWAQDTNLGGDCGPVIAHTQTGQEVTIQCTVYNGGTAEAEGVTFGAAINFAFQGDVQIAPDSFSVSPTQGTCEFVPASPTLYIVGCELGDLTSIFSTPFEEAVVTIRFVPTTSGTVFYKVLTKANNAPEGEVLGEVIVSTPGGEPGEDNGERVLVEHNGKELCLPKAALHGHLKHGGDEVIDEEGCSDAAAAKKNGKHERDGGASGK
jgi:hypothetical protein